MTRSNALISLTAYLDAHEARYRLLEHEPYESSEEATRITGISPENAAKSLLYKTLGGHALIVLPSSERVSSGALRRALGVKDVRLTPMQEMEQVTGCQVGTCHPIGRLMGVKTIVDPSLAEREFIGFSTGDPAHTITMEYSEYSRVAQPDVRHIRTDNRSS